MPRARNRWQRAVQVLRWLKDEFALPADLRFEVVESIDGDEVLGCVTENDGRLTVSLSAKMCRSVNEAVEVCIHEAAHVKLWDKGLGHLHGPKFWTTFGRMMDAFDHHGHLDSRSYPME
jgi:hypothetical protein